MNGIIRLEAENMMRLKAVTITPEGNLVIVGGKNAQGKTSVLRSIEMALGGTKEVPEVPVRKGSTQASVVVETLEYIITRKISASGTSTLEIRNREGVKLARPQELLSSLTSKISFDPLEFSRMDSKKQLETVRKIAGLDFSEKDAQRKKLYDERTLVNRQVDAKRIEVNNLPRHSDVPAVELTLESLLAELQQAEAHNKVIDDATERLSTLNDLIDEQDEEIRKLEAQLHAAKEMRTTSMRERDELKAAQAERESIDVEVIRTKIATAEQTNVKVRENVRFREETGKLADLERQSSKLTSDIQAIDELKENLLKEAQFPIEGLSFGDTGVTFNGIPFKDASAAEQLRVSLAISTALNPKLPVMLIRDGSLLDSESLLLVAEHAEKHGAQVWIEMVGDREDATVIIEDGEVIAEPAKTKTRKKNVQ